MFELVFVVFGTVSGWVVVVRKGCSICVVLMWFVGRGWVVC